MKKVLKVRDIQEILGICESTAYKLVKQAIEDNSMFKVVKVGKLYKIPTQPFLNWLDEL